MKKNLFTLLFAVAATLFAASCSDDSSDNGNNQSSSSQEIGRAATCWSIDDGNFITSEDVIMADDAKSVNISKAFMKYLNDKDEIKKGDVIGLYQHGILKYLHVTEVKDGGNVYMSYAVQEVDLEKTLEICNVKMDNIRLSTDLYMDPSKPKRVNNAGEADPNGIINTECYVEHAPDGTTIIHPMAVAMQAYYAGKNADEEDAAIPNGFVGCYVGQADQSLANNGFLDIVKKVGRAVISPVVKVYEVAQGTADLVKTVTFGGDYGFKVNVVDVNQTFNDEKYSLVFDPDGKPVKQDSIKQEPWTKGEWQTKVKGQAQVKLNGHIKAQAGAYVDLSFKPGKIDKFSTGAFALTDIDVKSTVSVGVSALAQRPVVLHRFDVKTIKFPVGPVPVVIVVYPELIWNTSFSGSVTAYADIHTVCKMNYDAHVDLYPSFDAKFTPNHPEGNVTIDKVGINGKGELKSGIYLRTSWELYSVTGPVFDFGASVSATGTIDLFKEEGKDAQLAGKFSVTGNIGEGKVKYAVKFPPLEKVSTWLYNKLSWESGDLFEFKPLLPIPIYKFEGSTDL